MTFWCIVIAYFLLLCAVSVAAAIITNKSKNEDSLLVASSSFPWYVVGLSMFAGCVGGSTTIGLAANVYDMGLVALHYAWSHGAVYIIIGLTFGKLKQVRVNNSNEFIGIAFFKRDNYLCGLLQSCALLGILGAQVLSEIAILDVFVLGLTKVQGALICIVFFGLFTLLGGIRAASWTNLINTTCIVIGLIACCIIGVNKVGGLTELLSQFEGTKYMSFSSGQKWDITLAWWLANALCGWGAAPEWVQYRSGRTNRDSKIGFLIAGIGQVLFAFVVGLIGLVAVSMFENCNSPLVSVANICGPVVSALTAVAMFAVIASTASAYFVSVPGQVLAAIRVARSGELTKNQEFWILKALTVLVGVIGFVVAVYATNIISVVTAMASLLLPISLITFCLWYCPKLMRKSTCTVTVIAVFAVLILHNFVKLPVLTETFSNIVYPVLIVQALATIGALIFDKRPVTPENAYYN